jgi:[acyl-carrier-protein] S-malonyltransferase
MTTAAAQRFCFLFPGQGSQKKGMLHELHAHHPEVQRTFEEASDALGYSMAQLCFEDPENQLGLTAFTQPALLCSSVAIWRVLTTHLGSSLGQPLAAGHSLGEYSALVACGVLELPTALKLVRARGQAMQQAVPVGQGGMAAYLGDAAKDVADLCAAISLPHERVEVANDNCPTQVVVSGHKAAIERFCLEVKARRLGRALPLPVSAPFHSSLMKPAQEVMAAELGRVTWGKGQGTILANIDAKPYAASQYGPQLLLDQIVGQVRWTSTLRQAVSLMTADAGASPAADVSFVEVGPGSVLQGLAKKTLLDTNDENLPARNIHVLGSDSNETLSKLMEHLGAQLA